MFVWHEIMSGPFYFYDKETGFNGVLCNKPECDHRSVGCNGAASAMPMVCYYEGKLYWLVPWSSDMDYYIYRMNPDSTERELFMTIPFDEDGSVQLQRMYIHRGKIYIVNSFQRVKEGNPIRSFVISVCDFDTHDASTLKPIFELETGGAFPYQMYFAGDEVFLMANTYIDGQYKLTVLRYNAAEDVTSTAADIVLDDEDYETYSFVVTKEGEMLVGQSMAYFGQETRAYRIVDNRLEAFMDFADDETEWCDVIVEEDVIFSISVFNDEPRQFAIWIKDYDGNTVYKGLLSTHYKDNLPAEYNEFSAYEFFGASNDRILAVLAEEARGEESIKGIAYFFVEYDITENGLEEKTLVTYYEKASME